MCKLNEAISKDIFAKPLMQSLRSHPKRIVFSEGEDARVVRVAGAMVKEELGVPILLGRREVIEKIAAEEGVSMEFVNVTNPREAVELDLFVRRLERIGRYQGRTTENAREVLSEPQKFGAMMVQYGHADAILGGNQVLPSVFFRALLRVVKPLSHVPRVFSAAVLVREQLPKFGQEGVLFLSDCGFNVEPSVEELALIAVETGLLARHHLGRRVRVAMLSHSTKGGADNASVRRTQAATHLARKRIIEESLEIDIEGEIQADVAVDPEAAEIKLDKGIGIGLPVDVLIFPNLDAAHISMKLLQHLAGGQNYGQLIMGLACPAAQVPRTASDLTIYGTALAIGVEAIKYHLLYPDGSR